MSNRVAAGREIVVRSVLIFIGASLIALAPRLVVIRPRLIMIARRLVLIRPRLILITHRLVARSATADLINRTESSAPQHGQLGNAVISPQAGQLNLLHRLPPLERPLEAEL